MKSFFRNTLIVPVLAVFLVGCANGNAKEKEDASVSSRTESVKKSSSSKVTLERLNNIKLDDTLQDKKLFKQYDDGSIPVSGQATKGYVLHIDSDAIQGKGEFTKKVSDEGTFSFRLSKNKLGNLDDNSTITVYLTDPSGKKAGNKKVYPIYTKSELADESADNITKDEIDFQTNIGWEQLYRYPDKYKGRDVKYSGKVYQVQNGDNANDPDIVLLAVNGNDEQLICVEIRDSIKVDGNLLENDDITISGIFLGTINYETTKGDNNTVPSVRAIVVDRNTIQ